MTVQNAFENFYHKFYENSIGCKLDLRSPEASFHSDTYDGVVKWRNENISVLKNNGWTIKYVNDFNNPCSSTSATATAHEMYNRTVYFYTQGELTKAFNWYKKSADQKYANAQYELGYIYESGKGITKDMKQAILWYQAAAEQGSDDAKITLKRLYATTPNNSSP